MNKRTYSAIGLMSGTSCDGIDLAHCHFLEEKNEWRYKIVNTKTISYSKKLRNKLISCGKTNSLTLKKLDNELGKIFSESLVKFINKNKISVDLISSHGHTVFHDIKLQLNHQIGNPLIIYKNTKVPIVHNFRELDVLHGGQGAPLVPYGEKKLFKGYDYCINIGGITNISSLENKKFYGYDICPANIILNKYARELGYDFDLDGKLSVRGKFKERLFSELNNLCLLSQKGIFSLNPQVQILYFTPFLIFILIFLLSIIMLFNKLIFNSSKIQKLFIIIRKICSIFFINNRISINL